MLIDQPIPEPLAPIQRQTPEQRLAIFNRESNSIYKKYSVYDQNTGPGIRFGSRQPLVYITVASSNFEKNITNADSQAIPIGSTVLDVRRITKFAASAPGVIYIGKQYLLQKQNAFNETRIYNPLSLISATAAKGSTGLIERPVRFLPTSGGIGNFIGNSLLSLVGIQSKDIEAAPDGTATGAALSSYVRMAGATSSKGLLRYATGDSGRNRFGTYFPPPGADPTQGPTKSLGSAIAGALINKLKSFIPSTNPFGFGGNANNKWEIRPEYKGTTGAYEAMYADKGGLLAIANTPPNAGSSSKGFVDTIVGSLKNAIFGKSPPAAAPISADARKVDFYHRYTPTAKYFLGQSNGNAVPSSNANPLPGALNINIDTQLEVLKNPSPPTSFNQFTYSTERLNSVKDSRGRSYKTYSNIGVGQTTYLGSTGNNSLPDVTSGYYSPPESQNFQIKDKGNWDSFKEKSRARPSTETLSEVKDFKGKVYRPYSKIGESSYTGGNGAGNSSGTPNLTSSYDQTKFDEKIKAIEDWDANKNNIRVRPSTERLRSIKDYSTSDKQYGAYKDINPDNSFSNVAIKNNEEKTNGNFFVYPSLKKSYSVNPKNSDKIISDLYDKYNAIDGPLSSGERLIEPKEIGENQSKDTIFFYFYDVINEKHLPFRATINSLSESNTVTWDPVEYLGRPDKMFLYKGFERGLSFGFTVYANSLRELLPMWRRINYLVGLARPPKYTAPAKGIDENIASFMYPPMVTFRIGDMYYDQPAVLTSISINIPDDGGIWETFRGTGDKFNYLYGIDSNKNIIKYDADVKSLQLPTKADISVNMNLMEKQRSQTGNDYFNLSAANNL